MSAQEKDPKEQQTDQGGPPAKGSDSRQINLDPSLSPETSAPESAPASRKAGKGQQEVAEGD